MKTTNYFISGANYYPSTISQTADYLPNNVFTVKFDPKTGKPYLFLLQEKYEFSYKIYGKDDWFVNRVISSWENNESNLGVLLNGIKGTGKTVTAELIANRSNCPIIVITEFDESLTELISEIDQDVVILLDEYEKVFKESHMILSLMDGTLNTRYKKLFLLTTNEKKIDSNMLERPSRIKYLKEYTSLNKDIINEIIDDMLLDVSKKESILQLLSTLGIITIDLVKSIVKEVNQYGDSVENYREFLNLGEIQKEDFSVLEIFSTETNVIIPNLFSMHPSDIMDYDDWSESGYDIVVKQYAGDSLYFSGVFIGNIQEIELSDDKKQLSIKAKCKQVNTEGKQIIIDRSFIIVKKPYKHKNML